MKLKIFFFPLALVTAIIIIIWYIWPAYEQSVAHKETLQEKKKHLSVLEERKALVNRLETQLNRDIAIKDFLFHYIPKKSDEEYLINAIDNAAKRAGINLVVVDILQGEGKSFFGTEEERRVVSDTQGADGMIAPKIKHPRIEEVTTDIVAIGPYDGMRKFISEMHNIDRLHGVLSASLERVDEENQLDSAVADTVGDGDIILGQMLVAFAQMGDVKIPRGADGSLFEKPLDLTNVRLLQAQNIAAPTLSLENIGRANPFVKGEDVDSAPEVSATAAPDAGSEVSVSENVL